MKSPHKNKTLATLFAFALGGLGIHRFYLYGKTNPPGWLHLASIPLSVWASTTDAFHISMFFAAPFVMSALAGFIEALVIGLTSDEMWDAVHNRDSGLQSQSRWPLALLLVLTLGVGATALIASIARTFDLLLTGGAFG